MLQASSASNKSAGQSLTPAQLQLLQQAAAAQAAHVKAQAEAQAAKAQAQAQVALAKAQGKVPAASSGSYTFCTDRKKLNSLQFETGLGQDRVQVPYMWNLILFPACSHSGQKYFLKYC